MRIKKATGKYLSLFLAGGFAYGICENLFRGYSHISMFIAGGICFILVGLINEVYKGEISFISQMFLSTIIITFVEFITGMIVNVWLKMGVWDYSSLPYNILGQISLGFSVIWFFLSSFAIIADDYIRYIFMGEEKPHYKIF